MGATGRSSDPGRVADGLTLTPGIRPALEVARASGEASVPHALPDPDCRASIRPYRPPLGSLALGCLSAPVLLLMFAQWLLAMTLARLTDALTRTPPR